MRASQSSSNEKLKEKEHGRLRPPPSWSKVPTCSPRPSWGSVTLRSDTTLVSILRSGSPSASNAIDQLLIGRHRIDAPHQPAHHWPAQHRRTTSAKQRGKQTVPWALVKPQQRRKEKLVTAPRPMTG
ncbi:unnamed protein product [Cuscuta epithymum]|uniref:Uncharacterized protein n=1 Tax=Cuscuta epithymum TaxID=186058 RepID=A0AAV0G4Q1_9ASTE|nr:unnamed protein product [Cuscuta epithymum]